MCDLFTDCVENIQLKSIPHTNCSSLNCFEHSDTRKNVKVEENKKKYLINNSLAKKLTVLKVDGGMIDNSSQTKCDYLVLQIEDKISIFVELKGSDVKHAFEQLSETINSMNACLEDYSVYARVICSSKQNVPNYNACPQYVKLKKILKKHDGDLEIKSMELTEDIAKFY
ncbi:hypothetical protein [Pseudobutyrivibrio xylanivorans]|uniref:Uncharacterized protein n=1 Tax=Pseudobutyrivibrio xylanivorans DSM 14809 TaxID=1123012 RepID=A0A1M6JEL3_PSEXY|nr:hypothetical protein [Pseudobutyrivibrio xylanivorans]SHJ45090.1 hypothetical protein SAMN02745725_02575 [Pseudobutyrivibrio xylanivorans DSM 14809]